MASFTERISVLIDVTVDRANKGINDFRTAVSEAEGVTGKLKAGVSSLGDQFRTSATNPAVMAGAVSAVGVFAVQAANQFADLGVEIGKFSDATGTATEDASRWVEVAGDLGINVGDLEQVMGKLNRSIDEKKFAELGVDIARTDDGMVDANETFLNAIDRLHSMKDPAQQAQAAADLFGRGWQNVAELVGMSADEVRGRLQDVADVKVFDEDKVRKSRSFRDAMDTLNDTFQEVSLQVGEKLVPALTALADSAPAAGGALGKMVQTGLDPAYGGLGKIVDALNIADDAQALFTDEVEGSVGHLQAYADEVDRGADSLVGWYDEAVAAEAAAGELQKQLDILNGTISQKRLWDDYATALWNFKDGAGDTAGELDVLRQAAADVVMALDDMPDSQKTEIIAQLNQGDIDTVNAILANYAKGIDVPLRFKGQGNVGFMKNATGTSFNPGGPTLVHKDEIINMPRGASVTPAGRAQQMRQRGLGGGAQIGTLIVQTNDQPRRWFDEALWRVAG